MTVKIDEGACHDCKRPYGNEHGFPDFVIDDAAWKAISPTGDEGGLLCPSCICKRLHDRGLSEVRGAFRSGPLCSHIQAEPVGFQHRNKMTSYAPWSPWHYGQIPTYKGSGLYEERPVYAAPPAPADRDSVIEECRELCNMIAIKREMDHGERQDNGGAHECVTALDALKRPAEKES